MQRRNPMMLTSLISAALGTVGTENGPASIAIQAPKGNAPDLRSEVRGRGKGKARAGAHASTAANKRRRGWS